MSISSYLIRNAYLSDDQVNMIAKVGILYKEEVANSLFGTENRDTGPDFSENILEWFFIELGYSI